MQNRPHDPQDRQRQQGDISREREEETYRRQKHAYDEAKRAHEQQRQQHQSSSSSRSNQSHREPFFRFFSSPNVHQHPNSTEEAPVRVKLEPLSTPTPTTLSTSSQVSAGGHQGMASYSYSAMARLSITSDGKEVEGGKDGRLPSIFANGDYGRDDSRFGMPGRGSERSPSGSGASSPNLVSVREIQERERSEEGQARVRRRSGLYSPVQNGREDGMINLPPLRHGFAPSSPGGSSSNHNHSESNYHREEGGRVTGPQRTGRPHSQSVSSMITSPYSHSATPSTTSLLLPSPSGLSNLRPSFAYSPPRSNKAPLAGPASARGNEFPRLERHISSTSLPGESSGFLRPHHSFFPGGGLSMFTSRSGDQQPQTHQESPSGGQSPPLVPAPAPVAARRGNIERLFRAATTRKKRSSSDASKTKGNLAMTEIKDDVDEQLELSAEGKDGKDLDPSAVRRLAHLQCEQRRRESINGGFATLRNILPETTAADSKAAILQKAINYIQNLEQAVRMSGGRLDPGMTRSPNLSSMQGQGRAPKRERRSTLSNSYSEAVSYPDDSHREEGGDGGLGLTGQTASSSTTDLVDVITDRDNREEGDETMRMDMDGEDDMAMAMSDEEDEVDDRRRVNGYGRGISSHQQQHQYHPQHSYQPNHHNQNHQHVPPPPPSTNGSHKKPGFSPLDLLVGVAEQARRVTGTGNHSKSQSHVDQAGHQLHNEHHHMGMNGNVNGNGNINGMGNGEKSTLNSKTGVNRGSWAHIEVGEGR